MPRHLAYTVALDLPGQTGQRNLARMLVSSLLRTHFPGDIVVFHNSPRPLFLLAREGVREVRVDTAGVAVSEQGFTAFAHACKYTAAVHLDPAGFEKVIFIDCDAVVLRRLDGLLEGPWDLAILTEPGTLIHADAYSGYLAQRERRTVTRGGMNSGTWAISAAHFHEFLRRWRKIAKRTPKGLAFFREQSAFNRVVLDWDGPVHQWSSAEVALPLCNPATANYRDYSRAAIVHAAGGDNLDHKLRFLFGVFAANYLFDSQLALLNIIEM